MSDLKKQLRIDEQSESLFILKTSLPLELQSQVQVDKPYENDQPDSNRDIQHVAILSSN